VEVLAVTADGRLAISGALHGLAKVWNLETGAQVHDLQRADNGINALAVSPDGQRVMIGIDRLRVFDLVTGTEPFALAGPERPVSVVAFSQDGQTATAVSFTGAWDLTNRPEACAVTVWDMRTGAEVGTFTGFAHRSRPVAVSADGTLVLAVSKDNAVEVWDPRERKLVHALPGHTTYLRAAAMTEDARLAVTGADWGWPMRSEARYTAEQDCALRVWDLVRGRELYTLPGHTGTVTAIAVTADGSLAVSASEDRTVRVWDLRRGRAYCTLTGHSDRVQAVAVTPDGSRVVSAASDHTIRVWDPHVPAAETEGHTEKVTAVAAVPDGRRAVSASADGMLLAWDATAGIRLAGWREDDYRASVLAALPDGRHALSGGFDGVVKLWDLDNGQQVHAFERTIGEPRSLAVSADGRWAACVTEYGEGAVYDLERLAGPSTLPVRGRNLSMTDLVVLTPDGLMIAATDHHTFGIWKAQNGRSQGELPGRPFLDGPSAFAVTPDGRRAAATAGRHTVVWDVRRRRRLQVLDNRTDFVTAAAVTPDGRRVLVAEDDSGITLWDADQGTIRSVLEGHTDHIQQLLVMADGRRAISVSGDTLGILPGVIADRSLRVWDLGQGTQIASFTAEGLITSVDMMPDGRTLIAGDAAGRVHFLLLEGITFTTARSS
jgi:WD40 repeat protein